MAEDRYRSEPPAGMSPFDWSTLVSDAFAAGSNARARVRSEDPAANEDAVDFMIVEAAVRNALQAAASRPSVRRWIDSHPTPKTVIDSQRPE